MARKVFLTAQVEESSLEGGEAIYTASFQEMPGVVCEGASAQAALAELFASAEALSQSLDADIVIGRRDVVSGISWEAFEGNVAVSSDGHVWGPSDPAASPAAGLENYRELHSLA